MDDFGLAGGYLFVALLCGVVSSIIWENKGGGSGIGFAMGFFLSVIGIVIAAIATPSKPVQDQRAMHQATTRECPHCKESMRRDASVCPHCQRDSQAWTLHENVWWAKSADGRWHWLDERTGAWTAKD